MSKHSQRAQAFYRQGYQDSEKRRPVRHHQKHQFFGSYMLGYKDANVMLVIDEDSKAKKSWWKLLIHFIFGVK